jgi:hypothetical protein
MPERRIKNNDQAWQKVCVLEICPDPEHEPARMVYRAPGVYSHYCPTCGESVEFEIPCRSA